MKISVILPCYNAATTLAEQLDALAGQAISTLHRDDWEIILIDNASQDESVRIAQSYQEQIPNLRILSATDGKSASYSRNVGAKAAMGEFLIFCDADDIVAPTWVEAMYAALLRPGQDFVASRFDYQRLNGRFGVQRNHLQELNPKFLPHAGGGGLGVRASVHQAIGGFDEQIRFLEDMEYCFRVQVAGYPLSYAEHALIHVRERPDALLGFRQAQQWGEYFPVICKKYEAHGLKKFPLWMVPQKYLLIFARSIRAGLKGDLKSCLRPIGWSLGYLIGCVRHRSMPFVELV
jgi:glycosyltransferase involved in cell wall biosynthesis